jgi:hypothetical protein
VAPLPDRPEGPTPDALAARGHERGSRVSAALRPCLEASLRCPRREGDLDVTGHEMDHRCRGQLRGHRLRSVAVPAQRGDPRRDEHRAALAGRADQDSEARCLPMVQRVVLAIMRRGRHPDQRHHGEREHDETGESSHGRSSHAAPRRRWGAACGAGRRFTAHRPSTDPSRRPITTALPAHHTTARSHHGDLAASVRSTRRSWVPIVLSCDRRSALRWTSSGHVPAQDAGLRRTLSLPDQGAVRS